MSEMLIEPAIEVLATTPSVMRAMLSPLPDDLIAVPDKNGWSARDVVAHLASRQQPAIIGRIRAILDNPGGPIPDVPPHLMDLSRYRTRPLDDLLRDFESGRAECVALLRDVTPDQFTWRGTHSGIGDLTIADIIHHVAYHDLIHIAQAATLTATPLEPLRGPMRRFR